MSTLWKVSTRNLWLAYRVGMTIRRGRGWAAIGALAVALTTLSGCGTDTPVEIPTQQPTSTPIFASDEEALAAAQEAYAAYVTTSDSILADGGREPERLKEVATASLYEQELVGYKQIASDGYRGVGSSTFDSVTLQSFQPSSEDGKKVVVIYVCSDVSATDVVDASGNSVISGTRPNRTPFEASFDLVDGRLIASGNDVWTGENFC